MGLLNAAQLTLADANAISRLSSTADRLEALRKYGDFADWFKLGLGTVNAGNTLLKTGQGIMAAYEAMNAGQEATVAIDALTSGQGISGLGSAGAAIGEALPWVGMGVGAYNMLRAPDGAKKVKAGINAFVPALLAIEVGGPAGAAAAAMYGALGLAQHIGEIHNRPSRDYFDPYYTADLGNGLYFMTGHARGEENDQTPSQSWEQALTDLNRGKKTYTVIYDKNTNQFYRTDIASLIPPEYINQEQVAALQAWEDEGAYGMGQGARPDLPTYVGLTPEVLNKAALDAYNAGQFKPIEVAKFKDTLVDANSGKDPVVISSLQSALGSAASFNNWSIAPPEDNPYAEPEENDMAVTVTDKAKYMSDYGISSESFDQQVTDGIINFQPTADDTPPVDDVPTVDDAPPTADDVPPPADAPHPFDITTQQLEVALGLQPGDLSAISDKLKAATDNVDTAMHSTISHNGLSLIPKGQQDAAINQLKSLLATYNPYQLAGSAKTNADLASQRFNQTLFRDEQQHKNALDTNSQINSLKKDYAAWAKDHGITRDYDMSTMDRVAQWVATLGDGSTINGLGQLVSGAGKVLGMAKDIFSTANPQVDPDDLGWSPSDDGSNYNPYYDTWDSSQDYSDIYTDFWNSDGSFNYDSGDYF